MICLNLNEPEDVQESESQEKATTFWAELRGDIRRRFFEPFAYPTYLFVFIIVIVLFGGAGTWITYFTATETDSKFILLMSNSLATYYLAIVAATFADVSLATFEQLFNKIQLLKKYSQDERKQVTPIQNNKASTGLSFWSFNLFVSSIVGILGLICLVKKSNEYFVLGLSILGTIISLFLWWIVNNDNKKLKESTFEESDEAYNPETAVQTVNTGEGLKDGKITY